MNILEIYHAKLKELGEEKVCELLESPLQMIRQYESGKKTPSLKTCQKILDLWGAEFIEKKEPTLMGALKQALIGRAERRAAELPPTHEEIQEAIMGFKATGPQGSPAYLEMEEEVLPPKKDLWQGRDVCLCLPWYKTTYPNTVLCLMAMWDKSRMRLEMRSEDSMITRSRNHLAKRFLNTGANWSIWFDDDMVFPFGHPGIYATITNMRHIPERFLSVNTIERLIGWGKTVVGGCYWDRRGGGKLMAGGGSPILKPIPSDTLHPVEFIGTGCLAVHRQVFLDIAAKFPETMNEDSLGNECGFFTNIQTPTRMMGEDESFAKRAADAGHPSYLDLGILCGHIGQNIHAIPLKGSKI